MKRHIGFLSLLAIPATLLAGCNNQQKGNDPIKVIDMEGTEVIVPKDVKKVAAISQSATDLMIAFGLGDKIAGTYRSFTYNTWVDELYPAAATQCSKLGKGFVLHAINAEILHCLSQNFDTVSHFCLPQAP